MATSKRPQRSSVAASEEAEAVALLNAVAIFRPQGDSGWRAVANAVEAELSHGAGHSSATRGAYSSLRAKAQYESITAQYRLARASNGVGRWSAVLCNLLENTVEKESPERGTADRSAEPAVNRTPGEDRATASCDSTSGTVPEEQSSRSLNVDAPTRAAPPHASPKPTQAKSVKAPLAGAQPSPLSLTIASLPPPMTPPIVVAREASARKRRWDVRLAASRRVVRRIELTRAAGDEAASPVTPEAQPNNHERECVTIPTVNDLDEPGVGIGQAIDDVNAVVPRDCGGLSDASGSPEAYRTRSSASRPRTRLTTAAIDTQHAQLTEKPSSTTCSSSNSSPMGPKEAAEATITCKKVTTSLSDQVAVPPVITHVQDAVSPRGVQQSSSQDHCGSQAKSIIRPPGTDCSGDRAGQGRLPDPQLWEPDQVNVVALQRRVDDLVWVVETSQWMQATLQRQLDKLRESNERTDQENAEIQYAITRLAQGASPPVPPTRSLEELNRLVDSLTDGLKESNTERAQLKQEVAKLRNQLEQEVLETARLNGHVLALTQKATHLEQQVKDLEDANHAHSARLDHSDSKFPVIGRAFIIAGATMATPRRKLAEDTDIHKTRRVEAQTEQQTHWLVEEQVASAEVVDSIHITQDQTSNVGQENRSSSNCDVIEQVVEDNDTRKIVHRLQRLEETASANECMLREIMARLDAYDSELAGVKVVCSLSSDRLGQVEHAITTEVSEWQKWSQVIESHHQKCTELMNTEEQAHLKLHEAVVANRQACNELATTVRNECAEAIHWVQGHFDERLSQYNAERVDVNERVSNLQCELDRLALTSKVHTKLHQDHSRRHDTSETNATGLEERVANRVKIAEQSLRDQLVVQATQLAGLQHALEQERHAHAKWAGEEQRARRALEVITQRTHSLVTDQVELRVLSTEIKLKHELEECTSKLSAQMDYHKKIDKAFKMLEARVETGSHRCLNQYASILRVLKAILQNS